MTFHERPRFPKGFRCASRNVGLKPKAKDLALFVSDVDAQAAALFTASGAPNRSSLVAGASASTWLFADGVHPTTGGHRIFADQVWAALKEFGWVPDNL